MGNLLFAQRLTQAVSTDRVLAQFCHSSVAVSPTGNISEERHVAPQNTFYDPRRQQSGPGARRRSAAVAAPEAGHLQTETPSGRRDTNGPAEAGERSTEPGFLIAAVCPLRASREAPASRMPPSRTEERAVRATSHRPPKLWASMGTG
jgi:hypothetical protein